MKQPDEASTLFVYGSLLDPALRERIIGRRVATIEATLHGYERGRARHYFVRKRAGAATPGLLLLELDRRDFGVIDEYEEVPTLYTREKVEVSIDGGRVRCWAYLPTSATVPP
ncbi:MAG TPA: gamma-glutamylcyclotransferase family protein [Candidatus Binataceae bacterium]|nr:gamma-glutamylcyclotransferase family protein [Candidatus Binataceae bacterium]